MNPFYTKSEYYEYELWKKFTTAPESHLSPVKVNLKPEYAFDEKLLYTWRCNLFLQANSGYSGYAQTMNLCFLDDPVEQYTNPQKYSEWMSTLSNTEKKIVVEFANSAWHNLDPSMEYFRDESDREVDKDGKKYTSSGFSTEETKLFSFVFNAFVFMQVFNQINARKLELGEWNVFSGMMANLPFLAIMIATIAIQLFMVEFGGRFVKCWPLNATQNLFCIVIGAGELIWGIFVKLTPTGIYLNLSLEDKDHVEGAPKKYMSTAMKGKGPTKK